ncbi:NUDIX hydrolase [Clostridium sp.]|uniref:NUDIX hydrolase n=1 Tax=Clostridium sp. TaxID=1506 RepID=UPI0025BF853A|nr:NUDIX hydrolase [Clostridium sp.]
MELWDGYNENEEKIGIDIVRGSKIKNGVFHAVVNVIVYHDDGTYLLMQRDWSKPNNPGLWEAGASGSVIKGEKFLDAAKRELFEETGIKADNLELIYTVKKPYKGTFYKVHICKCNIKKDSIILQEGETIDYKWVTKDEFIKTIELDNFITPDKYKLSNFIKTLYY